MKTLSRKIGALILISVLTTTVLTTLAGLFNANRLFKKDSRKIVSLTCENYFFEINSWLESIEQTVNVLYSFSITQLSSEKSKWKDESYIEEYLTKLYDVLENAALNTSSAKSVYLRINPQLQTSKTGLFLVKNEYGIFENHPITDLALYKSTDRNHVGWWYEPIAYEKPLWLSPYFNENINSEMISYVIPIFIQSELFGVIGMDIDLDLLKSKISEIALYDSGDGMLMSRNYDIIFSERLDNYKGKSDFSEEVKKFKKAVEDNLNNQKSCDSIKFLGFDMHIAVKKLLNEMILVIIIPEKEIDSERNDLIYQCLGILFIGILISMIICSKIIKRFTRSLTKLTSKAQELAKGNYELIVDDIDDLNEIKTLANSIKDAANQFDRSNRQINKLAYTDSLTGLKNRHCFDKFCKGLEDSFQKNIGVIFCDLNKLKFTNDNFGHEAGDKLICDFANTLKENFPTDECFRISGDEFIIVCVGLSEIQFEQIVKDFIALNKKQEVPVSAVGSCWIISTNNLNSLINEAEANMYRDKNEFYKRFPEFKR